MPDETIETLREKAAGYWKQNDFQNSIKYFTLVIEKAIVINDKDILKLMYSNRSACYLKVKNNTSALSDAEECIKIDSKWVKSHIRKGDALYACGRYRDAANVYDQGLKIDANDTSLKEKRDKSLSMANRPPPQPSYQPTASGGNMSSVSIVGNGSLGKIQSMGSYVIIIGAIISMIPFLGSIGLITWRCFLLASIVNRIIIIYTKHGFPQFNMTYAQSILPDPFTMHIVLSFLLISNRPYFLGGAPLFLLELTNYTDMICNSAKQMIPQLEPMIASKVPGYQPGDLNRLLTPAGVAHINTILAQSAIQAEIYQGIFLIIELLLPSRNFIMIYIWWQYLQMRYLLDSHTGNVKQAFVIVDHKLLTLLSHKYCPAIVRTGYEYAKGMMIKQVQDRYNRSQAGEADSSSSGGGGFMSKLSKCNIM